MSDTYALYLDDIRQPPSSEDDWVLCRTVADMRDLIESRGLPRLISFDYELGRTDPGRCGADAVQCLINWIMAMETGAETPVEARKIEVRLHTSSSYGAAHMARLLDEARVRCLSSGVRLVLVTGQAKEPAES